METDGGSLAAVGENRRRGRLRERGTETDGDSPQSVLCLGRFDLVLQSKDWFF
jgi:hypothetical protein